MSDRPLRSCDKCGGIDDHPRHIVDSMGNPDLAVEVNTEAVAQVFANKKLTLEQGYTILKDLEDTSLLTLHMDCCAERGCPDGSCDEILKKSKNAHGLDLVKAITGEDA